MRLHEHHLQIVRILYAVDAEAHGDQNVGQA